MKTVIVTDIQALHTFSLFMSQMDSMSYSSGSSYGETDSPRSDDQSMRTDKVNKEIPITFSDDQGDEESVSIHHHSKIVDRSKSFLEEASSNDSMSAVGFHDSRMRSEGGSHPPPSHRDRSGTISQHEVTAGVSAVFAATAVSKGSSTVDYGTYSPNDESLLSDFTGSTSQC